MRKRSERNNRDGWHVWRRTGDDQSDGIGQGRFRQRRRKEGKRHMTPVVIAFYDKPNETSAAVDSYIDIVFLIEIWWDTSDNFGISVFELGVATEFLSFLGILILLSHLKFEFWC